MLGAKILIPEVHDIPTVASVGANAGMSSHYPAHQPLNCLLGDRRPLLLVVYYSSFHLLARIPVSTA